MIKSFGLFVFGDNESDSYVITLSGRDKKQRTTNEYYVHKVCATHPSVHFGSRSDIQWVRKRRLIVIAKHLSIRQQSD